MLLPGSTTDPGSPAARMNEVCAAVEARPGIVDCTVFHGFPFTDSPEVGVHVVCTAEGDRALAVDGARTVAAWIWENRDAFAPTTLAPDEAFREAATVTDGLVVVNDTADNPGGGAPADATHVLRALLDCDLRPAAFGLLFDADAVRAAAAAGAGATIPVRLGGHHGTLHGAPIEATAYVKGLSDGRFEIQAIAPGTPLDVGPTARLVIDGVDVIVSSRPFQVYDPEVFLLHGIDVTRYRVVALKSTHHFRAGFRDVAARIITADSPGLTTQRVEHLRHTRIDRPMWPVDPKAMWS
jgi:microcystin degradation protein MlrC